MGEQCAWGGGVRIDGGELVLGGRLGFDGRAAMSRGLQSWKDGVQGRTGRIEIDVLDRGIEIDIPIQMEMDRWSSVVRSSRETTL